MKAPGSLRKALRIHAASRLVSDAGSMTNDDKVAFVNLFKTRIQAAVSDLAFEEREAEDVASMLLKAIVHHMGITKEKKHR